MNNLMPPINIQKWIEEHKQALKPPVCNKVVFKQQDFIIMVVGGPNQRKDFHYEVGPEFFYQLEGDMLLKIFTDGKVKDITIKQGEMFLLPPKIPHSPQRYANTIGLVIERKRISGEKDGLLWYCEQCNDLLYEEYFQLKNIEKDLPPVFDRFLSDSQKQTCDSCGYKSAQS
jgi:3-hydroxyanthranilate 3,4-dioxygenase